MERQAGLRKSNFFMFISTYFGLTSSTLLKRWISNNYKLIKHNLRLYYLTHITRHKLISSHIVNSFNYNNEISHFKCKAKFKNNLDRFFRNIQNIEIKDTHRKIHSLRKELNNLTKDIYRHIPGNLLFDFFKTQSHKFDKFYDKEIHKITSKIDKLQNARLKKYTMNTEPIAYSVINNNNNNRNTMKFEGEYIYTTDNEQRMDNVVHSVFVKSEEFINQPQIFDKKEKWFINLSSTTIPDAVVELLQFGENFSLPITNKRIIFDFIKDFENNIKSFDKIVVEKIRSHFIPVLSSYMSSATRLKHIDKEIILRNKTVLEFRKNHPNILFTRADKGSVTVAVDKLIYRKKINDMLSDKATYMEVKKNPISSIETGLNKLLRNWLSKEYISNTIYYNIKSSDGLIPRAYGVPKIHKKDIPYRLIISSIDSPLHKVAEYLHNLIYKNIPKPDSQVIDSFNLVQKLKGIQLQKGHIILSLDVISLFTNIPIELAIKGLKTRWKYIRDKTKLPIDDFLTAINHILSSTYFSFDGKIYKQTYGVPMGSPLSPIVAEIVMQDLESRVLKKLTFTPSFYYRYVDDIIMTAPRDSIQQLVKEFNNYNDRLQFTVEMQEGNEISFLDINIINEDDSLVLDWYHKPTFSGRYLNFLSNHPRSHKIGTIIGMIDRVMLLSHPKFQQKNLYLAINILINNNYPVNLIFNVINNRIKFLISTKLNRVRIINPQFDDQKADGGFFVLPYNGNISKRIAMCLKKIDTPLAYRCLNKLNQHIKTLKDTLEFDSNRNVVYKLECSNCETTYVGQTKRKLKTRLGEHRRQINRHTENYSVVTEHRIDTGHDFDWKGTKILDMEKSYLKRSISEMIHIKLQKNPINIMSDTEKLQPYFSLLEQFKS